MSESILLLILLMLSRLLLNLPFEFDNSRLSQWFPARVQHASDNGDVSVLIGVRPTLSEGDAVFEELTLTGNEVQAAAYAFDPHRLRVGSFIELGYYGQKDQLKIGLHNDGSLNDPDLIPLVPPPDRWYQRAVEALWVDVGGGH